MTSSRLFTLLILLSGIAPTLTSTAHNIDRISRGVRPSVLPQRNVNVFDIRNYGAVADGRTLATKALEAAVNAAAASVNASSLSTSSPSSSSPQSSQQAVVLVPFDPSHNNRSAYLTGSFALASHITLFIEHGASLLASTNPSDYTLEWNWDPALVDTRHATDVQVCWMIIMTMMSVDC